MNFDLTDDQEMMRDMFARFLDEHSSMARVRAAAMAASRSIPASTPERAIM